MTGHLSRRQLLSGAGIVAATLALSMVGGSAVAKPRYAVNLSDAEWRKRLSPAAYNVLRQEATERAWSSPLLKEHRRGIFACAGCGLPLFSSTTKFESGTGWPSFFRALPNAIVERRDSMLGMTRTETLCRRCGGHLGHVFDDGPKPTGLRYCMNGLALVFRPA